MATVTGALIGAALSGIVPARALELILGLALAYSVVVTLRQLKVELTEGQPYDPIAMRFGLEGTYFDVRLGREVKYRADRVKAGFAVMWGAGLLSGLLGIGSGAFKVLALDYVMRLPMKVSTATSNFMIGITAAASAAVYFGRGDIHPVIATPVALGVMLGASVGTTLIGRLRNTTVRALFLPVISVSRPVDDRARAGAGRIVSRVEGVVSRVLWWGGVAGIVLMLIGLVSYAVQVGIGSDSFDVTRAVESRQRWASARRVHVGPAGARRASSAAGRPAGRRRGGTARAPRDAGGRGGGGVAVVSVRGRPTLRRDLGDPRRRPHRQPADRRRRLRPPHGRAVAWSRRTAAAGVGNSSGSIGISTTARLAAAERGPHGVADLVGRARRSSPRRRTGARTAS